MGALPGEKRPRSARARTIEGLSILVFAVAIAIVTTPDGTARRVDLEERVNDLDRVQDAPIIGGPETEANQRKSVGTYHVSGRLATLLDGSVLDRHKALDR